MFISSSPPAVRRPRVQREARAAEDLLKPQNRPFANDKRHWSRRLGLQMAVFVTAGRSSHHEIPLCVCVEGRKGKPSSRSDVPDRRCR